MAFLIVALSGAFAFADDAYIVNVVRGEPLDRIVVSATLKGAFTPEIRKSIDSGAPVTFTYFLQLKRLRALVWDKTVHKVALKRMVKFDALKKEYLAWEKKDKDEDDIDFKAELENVNLNETGEAAENTSAKKTSAENTSAEQGKPEPSESKVIMEPLVFKKVQELEKWMTHIENFDLGPIEDLNKSAIYKARVRCKMKQIKLIPPFNYILFFMSLLDFDTEWTNSTTFTINGAGGQKNISSVQEKTTNK